MKITTTTIEFTVPEAIAMIVTIGAFAAAMVALQASVGLSSHEQTGGRP